MSALWRLSLFKDEVVVRFAHVVFKLSCRGFYSLVPIQFLRKGPSGFDEGRILSCPFFIMFDLGFYPFRPSRNVTI